MEEAQRVEALRRAEELKTQQVKAQQVDALEEAQRVEALRRAEELKTQQVKAQQVDALEEAQRVEALPRLLTEAQIERLDHALERAEGARVGTVRREELLAWVASQPDPDVAIAQIADDLGSYLEDVAVSDEGRHVSFEHPGGGVADTPSATPLSKAEVNSFRERLRNLGRRPGHDIDAGRAIAAFDAVVLRGDIPAADLRQMMTEFEQFVVYRRPLSRGVDLAEADLTDPEVRAALETSMDQPGLHDNLDWHEYQAAVIAEYTSALTIEIGPSPRSTDRENVAVTNLMRARFLEAHESGTAHAAATAAFDRHVADIRKRGSDATAVADGNAVWLDPLSGARLEAYQPNAVLWPADNHGVWRVDHIVELQHGGADDVSNYFPVSQTMHGTKSSAMIRFADTIKQQQR